MGDSKYEFTIDENNKTDFNLKIVIETTYNMYLKILQKVCDKVDKEAYTKLKETDNFDIPEKYGKLYFPRVRDLLKKNINAIYEDIKLDKIHVLYDKIVRMTFKRVDNITWEMIIYIEGMYIRK